LGFNVPKFPRKHPMPPAVQPSANWPKHVFAFCQQRLLLTYQDL